MFKNPNQRKAFFEKENEKKGEIQPEKSQPNALPTSHPPQMTHAPKVYALGALGQTPKFHPPGMGTIHPTSNPNMHLSKPGATNPISIPALPSIPRFGKTRKFFK